MDYLDKKGCNIKNFDAYIRIIIGVITIYIVYEFEVYYLLIVTIMLFYTGIKKHCYIYDLFKKDGKFSLKNYYTSHLPKYNPSAVFMFDKDGEMYYENESGKRKFPHIQNLEHFSMNIGHETFENKNSYIRYYEFGSLHYQLNIQQIKEINSIVVYATDVTEIILLNKEIEDTQKEIIYTMGAIGESRSKETGNHVKRVAEYSYLLGKLYGLNEEDAKLLKLASPMHDIGKVAIPDNILNKPAKLDKDEFEVIKTHTHLGYEMLKNSSRPIIKAASIVANEHHEKWDGTGYPKGLATEEIHIYGRITALVDVFDALGSERVYKEAWDMEKIISYIKSESGKYFDPNLVTLFLSNLNLFLEIKEKYKN